MDFVDHCTTEGERERERERERGRERASTKWRLCKLTKVSVSASLLTGIPMSCEDTVLPEPLLKTKMRTVLLPRQIRDYPTMTTFVFFRTLALHLHENDKLEEETSKFFNFFCLTAKTEIPQKFKVLT